MIVGIDDTDTPDVGGTGRLSRCLVDEIEASGVARSLGVTRHQLFEGPGVPKTSRNSAAAVALSYLDDIERVTHTVTTFVRDEAVPGSDPGVAFLGGAVATATTHYARRTQREVVERRQAIEAAQASGLDIRQLGGKGNGVIGAVAAVALRAHGNDGRFVGLRGIRDIAGRLPVGEVLRRTGVVDVVEATTHTPLDHRVTLDVGDWVRPRVVEGRAVLVARMEQGRWVNADARHA